MTEKTEVQRQLQLIFTNRIVVVLHSHNGHFATRRLSRHTLFRFVSWSHGYTQN